MSSTRFHHFLVPALALGLAAPACGDEVFVVASATASGSGTSAHTSSTGATTMTGGGGSHAASNDAATSDAATSGSAGASGGGGGACDGPVTGPSPAGPGALLWSRSEGPPDNFIWDDPQVVATNALGDIVVAGNFYLEARIGCSDYVQDSGVFVADYDAKGHLRWNHAFDVGHSAGQIVAVATDDSGNVFLSSKCDGAPDFGGGPLPGAAPDLFVAKFDLNGNHVWSKRLGGNGNDQTAVQDLGWIGTDAKGNLVVAGTFDEAIDFGDGPLVSGPYEQGFVAKLDPQGTPLFATTFTGSGDVVIARAALDASGAIVIDGLFDAEADFGPFHLQTQALSGFLVKLDASATPIWAQAFTDGPLPYAIAIDKATGDIALERVLGDNDTPVTLARFDGNGTQLWTLEVGSWWFASLFDALQYDASGNVLYTNTSTLSKLDSNGVLVWNKPLPLGADGAGSFNALGIDSSGNAIVFGAPLGSGAFGPYDFGGGPIDGIMYLTKFAP